MKIIASTSPRPSPVPLAPFPLSPSGEGWGEGWCARRMTLLIATETHPHPNPPLEGEGLWRIGLEGAQRGFAKMRLLKWIGDCLALPSDHRSPALLDASKPNPARASRSRARSARWKASSHSSAPPDACGPLTLTNVRYTIPPSASMRSVGTIVVDVVTMSIALPGACTSPTSRSRTVEVALTTRAAETRGAGFGVLARGTGRHPDRSPRVEESARSRRMASRSSRPILSISPAHGRAGLVLKSLALRAPDGSIDLHGTMSSRAGISRQRRDDVHVESRRTVEFAGTLKAKATASRRRSISRWSADACDGDCPVTQTRDAAVDREDRRAALRSETRAAGFDADRSRCFAGRVGRQQHGALNGEIVVNGHRVSSNRSAMRWPATC